MSPRDESVAALYALTNSMMFTPCWPSAGPTGGAGVAWPAGSWSVNVLTSFFFGGMSVFLGGRSLNPTSRVRGECRGYRGARTLTRRRSSRTNKSTPAGLDLGDLVEVELDRRLPTEDRHQHLQLLLVGVDLADRRRQ